MSAGEFRRVVDGLMVVHRIVEVLRVVGDAGSKYGELIVQHNQKAEKFLGQLVVVRVAHTKSGTGVGLSGSFNHISFRLSLIVASRYMRISTFSVLRYHRGTGGWFYTILTRHLLSPRSYYPRLLPPHPLLLTRQPA